MAMEKNILVINIGSSSKKYSLYSGEKLSFAGHFEQNRAGFAVTFMGGKTESISVYEFHNSLRIFSQRALKAGFTLDKGFLSKVGIRLVASGEFFTQNHIVDKDFLKRLAVVAKNDFIHIQPVEAEIKSLMKMFPEVEIVAVSDSAFHTTIREEFSAYAISKKLAKEKDIRRFGFHGLSAGSVVRALKKRGRLPKRIILCHLGSGSSVTTILNGKSVDTSMGYSPLEGLISSSRVGDIGVGAVLHLAEGERVKDLRNIFYKESGLLAISGLSGDMRVLIQAEKEGHAGAHEAIEVYINSVIKHIGASVAVLGGIDALVFSGMIGERSFIIRERICRRLSWLDIKINTKKNAVAKSGDNIATFLSTPVLVVHADEAYEILKGCNC